MSATNRRGPRPRREGPSKSASGGSATTGEADRLAEAFFANAGMAFAFVSPDLRFLRVNAALCELAGRPESELVGAPAALLFPPEEGGPTGVIEQVLAEPSGRVTVQRRLQRPGGEPIWARLEISVVRDKSGQPLFYLGTAQDVTVEREALEQLERERHELTEAEAIAQVGSWHLDLETGEGSCSAELRRIFEIPDDQPLSHERFLERIPAEERDWVRRRFQAFREDGRSFEWEHRIIRGDGSEGFVHSRGHLVERDGQRWLVGTSQDVSRQKQAERAAAEATERFVTAFEDAPIGISIVSTRGEYLQVNPALCAMLGYSREQLLERSFPSLTHPDDLDANLAELERLTSGEKATSRYEKRFMHADGHVVWATVAVSIVRDETGEPLYLVAQVEDVSERKQAEQSLAEATERFRNAFENAPIGMALGRLDGTVVDANPALCAISGYTREQLLTKRWQDVALPEDVETSTQNLAELAAGKRSSYQVDWRFIRADGGVVWTTTSISVVRGEAGEPLYFVVQIDDITERREMARAMAEASERIHGAFENAPIGMAVSGPDGKWLQVNPALCAMLGYSEDELLATTFQAVTHPDDQELSMQQMQRLLDGEAVDVQFEKRYLNADGGVVWVILSTSLVRDEVGAPLYFVTQMVDVSERRRAERALAEALELFAQAFENTPVGMALTKPGGELLQVNQALCEMLGYSRERLLATTLLAITHPDDVELSHREFGALWKGEAPTCRFEKRYVHADGQHVWVLLSASAIRDEKGEASYMVVQMLDITERRRLDELLARNAALLEEAQQLARVGSFEWDIETHEIKNSRELHRIHGTDPDTFVPTLDWLISVVHEDDRERMRELWATHTAEPSEAFRIIRADGTVRHLVTHARIQLDETGKPVRVFGAVQDVTERVEAEAERLELEARMQEAQRLESLGVLAGGIAHDFNNLLVGVLGNAGLAALELPPSSPARLLIDQIEIAARRAAELTKQMLAYSGRGQFVVQPLDLRVVVREMSALLESAIPKNVALHYECAEELPAVRADVAQIRQLVMNLITNAADAIGDAGGRIEIRIGQRQADAAFLAEYSLSEGLPEGTYVTLDVTDDGAGMDAETLARIFDPFFTTKFSGHGLGLAAALGIVRGHHGAIRVESEKGVGSSFRLVLPAVEDPAEKPGSLPVPETWKASGTVLVVDDEEIVRRAVHRILSTVGLTVVEAESAAEALRLFGEAPDSFDVALVDLVMPGMTGEELVEALHALEPRLPVILTSGYDARAVMEALGEAGTRVDFLQKPYHPRDLLDCVRRRLAEG